VGSGIPTFGASSAAFAASSAAFSTGAGFWSAALSAGPSAAGKAGAPCDGAVSFCICASST